MERVSRFIIDHVVNAQMFQELGVDYINQGCYLSDGERHYGNTLFEMCAATNWFMQCELI